MKVSTIMRLTAARPMHGTARHAASSENLVERSLHLTLDPPSWLLRSSPSPLVFAFSSSALTLASRASVAVSGFAHSARSYRSAKSGCFPAALSVSAICAIVASSFSKCGYTSSPSSPLVCAKASIFACSAASERCCSATAALRLDMSIPLSLWTICWISGLFASAALMSWSCPFVCCSPFACCCAGWPAN